VATVEERLAYLEGKIEEHSRGFGEIRDALQHLDQRLTFLDQKVDRFRDELAARIESLDQRVSKQFIWLVGIQIMVLLAVIGALLGK
jgi:uncharacterized coiled-coil protein SlyX